MFIVRTCRIARQSQPRLPRFLCQKSPSSEKSKLGDGAQHYGARAKATLDDAVSTAKAKGAEAFEAAKSTAAEVVQAAELKVKDVACAVKEEASGVAEKVEGQAEKVADVFEARAAEIVENFEARAAEVAEAAEASAIKVMEYAKTSIPETAERVEAKVAEVAQVVEARAGVAMQAAETSIVQGVEKTKTAIKATKEHSSLFNWYTHQLETKPLITKSLTTGVVGGMGDILAQAFLSSDPYQPRRTLAMMGTGVVLSGPLMHFWYGLLNSTFAGNGVKQIGARLALDQAFFTPIFTPVSLFTIQALEGRTGIVASIQKSYASTVKASWTCWVPAQSFNFAIVPAAFQVLYVNAIGLGWSMYLAKTTH